MSSDFKVSVVIPFYNAREYVTQAVESALAQPETGEVILIDDNSPDGGLILCQGLAHKHKQVRVLRHPDGQNHGAAASRNVGILNARFPYIAFLDADDYFLSDRFSKTAEVFSEHQDAEGVYEAIGALFQEAEAQELWNRLPLNELTTINRIVPPEVLFEKLLFSNLGSFSFDGFTGKRDLFSKVGLFNEKLKYFEDTELMYKLAAKGILYPGSIAAPIAIRRVHNANRITHLLDDERKTYAFNLDLWLALLNWGEINLTTEQNNLLALRFIERLHKADYFNDFRFSDLLLSRKRMAKIAWKHPALMRKQLFWRKLFPAKKLIGLR